MNASVLRIGTLLWLTVALARAGGVGYPAAAQDLAIRNATLIAGPGQPAREGETIVVRDGRIAAIGPNAEANGIEVLDAAGRVVTAGLWNSHVHHTDPALPREAERVMSEMLLRYGFTSVLDTGSDPSVLVPIVQQIESGEIDGPRIRVAGGSFVYTQGTPVYLPGIQLPELAQPAAAAPAVNAVLSAGAHGIKIFAGSFMGPERTIWLPPEIIRAVTEAAHARGSFVVAHPTDLVGLRNAVESGVDVLAHTAPPAGPLSAGLLATMIEHEVALIPTLKLWAYELERAGVPEAGVRSFQQAGVDQVRQYLEAGGEILFGTDVGYMRDFDTTDEYRLLGEAGLDFDQLLATLTTNPARRFAEESGVVEVGGPGDLVVFSADPRGDLTAFARVANTVRSGRVVYSGE